MCGIVGFYSTQKLFTQNELEPMMDSLIHRGPDAFGKFNDDFVGLGHRRLSIIDLSEQANQPMFSHSGKSVIVYNGEVYNFRELSKELGIQTKTMSDTEIILEAFEKWGPGFVSKLNGMFAISIYQKSTQKLFLYRDRLGIKPLFYFIENGQLAFSSELKAFTKLAYFNKTKQINKTAIASFLQLGYIPAPDTIYNHVYKFPQGSYAIFDGKELSLKSYWNANNAIKPKTITNFDTAKEQLSELLNSSINYRLISDVPYGTFLSGGIDSSLVTAVAQKVSNHQLKTFSIGFSENQYNESVYAKQVANHLNTNHHEFILTEKEALNTLPDIFAYYDEPFADSSAIPTMLVSKMARSEVTMTLSGDGGDELFHGYGMYNWAQRLDNPLYKNSRTMLKQGLSVLGSRYQRIAKMFDYRSTDDLKTHIFSQEQYFFSQKELESLLTNSFNHSLTIISSNTLARSLNAKEKQALFDINYYLPDDLLVKVDRASMRFSLETRVPLLDYRIVEFALNLSPTLKVKNGVQKFLLKELLYDYVPKSFFNRPKWGFSIPMDKWLKTELRYLIDEYLSETKIKEAGFLNYQEAYRVINQYLNSNISYLYYRVWDMLCLHRWYFDTFKNG